MPNRISPIKIGAPSLPPIPYRARPGELINWINQLYIELEIYFNKMKDNLVDTRGFLMTDEQRVTDAFIIVPSAAYVDIRDIGEPPTTIRTSDLVTAISVGTETQSLVISNVGSANIVLKHGAQTFFPGGTDITLLPLHSVFLRWDHIANVWTQVVTG